jgi:predicted O-linked N-acetylglucosamine transferase (SPINDLY family)
MKSVQPLIRKTATTHFEQGNAYLARNDFPRAIEAYQEALSLAPELVEALYNCGVSFHKQGELGSAADCYRQAIRRSPELAEAHFNLAHACDELNRFDEAEAAYREVLRLQPENAAAAYNLGYLHKSRGNYADALTAFQEALHIRPDYAQALNNIGLIWSIQDRLDEALICFEQSLAIKPDLVEAHYNLGVAYQKSGELWQARECYRRALDLDPHFAPARSLYLLSLPILYANPEEIEVERARFAASLNQLIRTTALDTPEQIQRALRGVAANTNFYLQYQGRNDLELQKEYGLFVTRVMAANYPQWSIHKPMPVVASGRRIRVGYLSSCMHAHTAGIFLMGWLEHGDRSQLETFCYHVGERSDEWTAKFRDTADHFHHFPGKVAEAAAKIEADNLHILVHTDIGMNAVTLQLAALRLAPVQCKGWGHPVTTGLPTIDYYLTSDLMEPEQADQYYSETLIRLPNLALNYSPPRLSSAPKTRSMFGLPDDAVVYLSSQSLFKYLPQHDDIYPRIARQVPEALFVFFSHSSPKVTAQLKRRFQHTFQKQGIPARLLFLPRLCHDDFLSLNLAADVLLDTLEWSGGHTTLEALSCDLPVVTLPGKFMRGRHSYAFLKRMGLTQTIAAGKDDFIRLAVRLGQDHAFRTAVRDHIKAHKSLLFKDRSVNTALEVFYRQVVTGNHSFRTVSAPADEWPVLFNTARALQVQGRLDEAARLYLRVLAQNPEYRDAHNNLGNIYNDQKKYAEAIACYRRVVAIKPDLAQGHYNLGSALRQAELFEEALIHLQRAVQLLPDYAEAWNNLALTFKNVGDFDQALASFDRAVALAPQLAAAHWNRSFIYMLKEEYGKGWRDFHWRFSIPQWKSIYPYRLPGRFWDGRPAPGETILVHDEQGLGDTLQFVRYLPQVKALCAKVILETRNELVDLLCAAPGIDQLITRSSDGQPKAEYDHYIPLMSLPGLFGTTRQTIPRQVPYVFADAVKSALWRTRLQNDRPKIGLLWAGRPQHTNDHNRSCPLTTFLPLMRLKGLRFVGLQKGPAAEQVAELPAEIDIINLGDELHDFSDTAALVANLDLVITVDTAVAHLAGAMGRPVWVMIPFIPDWRWGLHGSDTPWYPTMRLFRQPRLKAWEPVVQAMQTALGNFR